MSIRTVYHASDGTQHPTRASASRHERASEFVDWMNEEVQLVSESYRAHFVAIVAERWYIHDRLAPRRRGKPKFTGSTCLICGGQMEEIAGFEVCATCETEVATRLREKEAKHAPVG